MYIKCNVYVIIYNKTERRVEKWLFSNMYFTNTFYDKIATEFIPTQEVSLNLLNNVLFRKYDL